MIVDVAVDHPEDDQQWDRAARSETETERLDRNWASLLQELRVVQTGVQLLTGLLLTLPFQQRFDILDDDMQVVDLATVAFSVAFTVLLVAPVGMHRVLFRRHRLKSLGRRGTLVRLCRTAAARHRAGRRDDRGVRRRGRPERGDSCRGVCAGGVRIFLGGGATGDAMAGPAG